MQQGLDIMPIASTGLAGFLIGGRTLHSRWVLDYAIHGWLLLFTHVNIQRPVNVEMIYCRWIFDDELWTIGKSNRNIAASIVAAH